jgi:putative acetyltransferase
MEGFVIEVDDPRRDDVRALLEQHLEFVHEVTPPEDIHALDLDGLLDPAVTFFSLRLDGRLLGVGAIKRLDPDHVELKSMHTVRDARGRGVGRAIVDHLVGVASTAGARRVSLETGSMEAFAPARSLYASAGFVDCGPFGDYEASPSSTFMTRLLGEATRTRVESQSSSLRVEGR